jgi:hypothetical protein
MKSSHPTPQPDPQVDQESKRASHQVTIEKVTGLSSRRAEDTLAVEEPLEIQLAHGSPDARSVKSISVTMRTPGHDFDLAAGFLMTEGVVRDPNDIDQIVYAPGSISEHPAAEDPSQNSLPYQPTKNVVRVELAPNVIVSLANLERNFYTTQAAASAAKPLFSHSKQSAHPAERTPSASTPRFSTNYPIVCAKPRASSTEPAEFTAQLSSTQRAISSPHAKTSVATTLSTSSSAPSFLPTELPFATRYSCSPDEPASSSCKKPSWPEFPWSLP